MFGRLKTLGPTMQERQWAATKRRMQQAAAFQTKRNAEKRQKTRASAIPVRRRPQGL